MEGRLGAGPGAWAWELGEGGEPEAKGRGQYAPPSNPVTSACPLTR